MNALRRSWIPRRFWRLIAVLGAAVLVALFRNWPFDVPERVDGRAHVVDGDSLRVADDEVRLVGIDAPELRQICQRNGTDWACGKASRNALRKLLNGRPVACDVEGVDKYDRLLAVCHVRDQEVNAWMVQNGWAVSYGGYRSEERRADRDRKGIWAGEFENPKDWRDQHLRGALAAAAS